MDTLFANWEWIGLSVAGLMFAGTRWRTIAQWLQRDDPDPGPVPVLPLVDHYRAIAEALEESGELDASDALAEIVQPAIGRIILGGRRNEVER